MNHLIIINSGLYPVPAIRGGAVSELVQLLLDENEKNPHYYFHVFSIYDEIAQKRSKKYNYSHFIYIKKNSFFYISRYIISTIWDKIDRHYLFPFFHIKPMPLALIKYVNRHTKVCFGAVIVEGATQYVYHIKKRTNLKIIQRYHNIPTTKLSKLDLLGINSTDFFIGISKYVCSELLKVYNINNPKVKLLYNSVNFDKFRQQMSLSEKNSLQEKYQLKNKDFIILYTGRIQEYKGVKELMLAFEQFAQNKKDVKLIIVGSCRFSSDKKSKYEESLYEIAERQKGRILMTGFVSNNKLYMYYQLASISVFPSTWEEPFALTCLESLVCGTPVIITNSGGMVEVVDSNCSIVVNKGDDLVYSLTEALDKIYSRRFHLTDMKKAAVKRSAFFSSEKYFDNFRCIIDNN